RPRPGGGPRPAPGFRAASPVTFATRDDGTPFQASANWSLPLSAMTRLAPASASGPNVHTILSGYAWRTGSVFGSQFSLRSITSSTPLVFLVILYGPDENGWLSGFRPGSLSGA